MLIINLNRLDYLQLEMYKIFSCSSKVWVLLGVNNQRIEFIGVLWYKKCYTVDSFNQQRSGEFYEIPELVDNVTIWHVLFLFHQYLNTAQ